MAGSRAGLKRVVKSVRSKKGTARRTYWVKAQEAAKGAGRFLNRHKSKIAAGAALVGAAALAAHNRGAIKGAYHGARIANRASGTVSRGMKAVTGSGMSLRTRFNIIRKGAVGGAKVGGAADYLRHNPTVVRKAATSAALFGGEMALKAGASRLAPHLLKGIANRASYSPGGAWTALKDGVSLARHTRSSKWAGRGIATYARYGD